MGKEAKFYVNEAFQVPEAVTTDGRANWLRVLDTKTIPRASTVFGAPELASNNVAVPSVDGYTRWLSQVTNPTTTYTPSGEDINEVILTQKINTLYRLPFKMFQEFSEALKAENTTRRTQAADKWARNFSQFADVVMQAVGVNALLPGIAQAAIRFLDNDSRFKRVHAYQQDIIEDDHVSCLDPSLSRQASSLVGIFTRALIKTNQAFRAGVEGTELTAFIAVQQTRMLAAISGFVAAGKTITVATVIVTPRKGLHVKCEDET